MASVAPLPGDLEAATPAAPPGDSSTSSSSPTGEPQTPPLTFSAGLSLIAVQAQYDAIQYFSEVCDFNLSRSINAQKKAIVDHISGSDVVLFGKVGCGFCKRAKDLLADLSTKHAFTLNVIDVAGNKALKAGEVTALKSALTRKLHLFDLTFPQIVVKGQYVGGADDFQQLVEEGGFPPLLAGAPNTQYKEGPVYWTPKLAKAAASPNMLYVPRVRSEGSWYPHWPWYAFNWAFHANLVRYISMAHILLLLTTGILQIIKQYTAAQVVYIVYLYDLFALVVIGPSPFSVSGVLSTYFGWKVRGNATSAVPYKVVWTAYILSLVPILLLLRSRDPTDSTDLGKERYKEANKKVLETLVGQIVNSLALSVFRL